MTTTSQLTSTTEPTSTSAYDTSKHFLSYDRCHNSRPHKRNVGHTRCLRHTHVLVKKYTSTSSCKHCIVDQNIILKSKTRDLYLFSLYTICLWTQKDSPIPPQQISVPSNLSAELAYLFSRDERGSIFLLRGGAGDIFFGSGRGKAGQGSKFTGRGIFGAEQGGVNNMSTLRSMSYSDSEFSPCNIHFFQLSFVNHYPFWRRF